MSSSEAVASAVEAQDTKALIKRLSSPQDSDSDQEAALRGLRDVLEQLEAECDEETIEETMNKVRSSLRHLSLELFTSL